MINAVVWGSSGVLAGVCFLGFGFVFLLGWLAYAHDEPRHGGLQGWVSNWRALTCVAMVPVCLFMTVSSVWAATHVRTVTLTVAHLRIDYDDRTSYYVDGAKGESYDTSATIHGRLQEGDRVRCEATDPLLFVIGTLLSCTRMHTRYAAATALDAARRAAARQVLQ